MEEQSILIIEKDVAVRNHLSKKFNNLGMLVITAEEGYEGYNRACNESPNFIVTETLLPNLNGFKICYLLKHDDRYRDIPIALITSNELAIEKQNFESCKADVILKKPFKFSQLAEKMKLTQSS